MKEHFINKQQVKMDAPPKFADQLKSAKSRASTALVLSIIAVIILIVLAILVILFYHDRSILESEGIPLVPQSGLGVNLDHFNSDAFNVYMGTTTPVVTGAVKLDDPLFSTSGNPHYQATSYDVVVSSSAHNVKGRVLYVRNNQTFHQGTIDGTKGMYSTNPPSGLNNNFIHVVGASSVSIPSKTYVGPGATLILVGSGTNTFVVLSNSTIPFVPYSP